MSTGSDGAVGRDVHGDVYPLTLKIASRRKKRKCLHCGDMFNSPGPGFRFCTWCKSYLHHNSEDDEHETQVRPGRKGRVDSASLGESIAAQGHTADDFIAEGSGGFDEDTDDVDEPTWRIVHAM